MEDALDKLCLLRVNLRGFGEEAGEAAATTSAELERIREGSSVGVSWMGATEEEERIALCICPVVLELENTPSSTDHLLRPLRCDRTVDVEFAVCVTDSGFDGSTVVLDAVAPVDCEPSKIACCGRLVPGGGRPGNRLSNNA